MIKKIQEKFNKKMINYGISDSFLLEFIQSFSAFIVIIIYTIIVFKVNFYTGIVNLFLLIIYAITSYKLEVLR